MNRLSLMTSLSFGLMLFLCLMSSPLGWAESDEITDHYRRMMIYHEYMDGNVPEGAVVFIGDSITQGLCVSAVAPLAINYGIGSDTTYGVLKRLPKYKSLERCGAVVFAIGVNDLSRRNNKEIVSQWQEIMERIPAGTPAVFSGILPMDPVSQGRTSNSNERILELNATLAELCAEKNHVFVNAGPLITNEEGNLDSAYHTGDGVHLNTAGYEKWIAVLREGLEKIIPSAA
ncbi:MAG: hypothetical protein GX130_03900 [Candidatus Hydrogenedens sp.]|nr:hypothetical protein [Candidatus Hydrogenedens sp.]